jgi:hypothetical protein
MIEYEVERSANTERLFSVPLSYVVVIMLEIGAGN